MKYRIRIEETSSYIFDIEIADADIDEHGSLDDAIEHVGIETMLDAPNLDTHYFNTTDRKISQVDEISE